MDKLVFTAHMIPHNARLKVNIQTTQPWWFKSWGIWPTVFIIMLEIWVRHICRHISRMHIASLFMVCYYSLTQPINYAFKSTSTYTCNHCLPWLFIRVQQMTAQYTAWQGLKILGKDVELWKKQRNTALSTAGLQDLGSTLHMVFNHEVCCGEINLYKHCKKLCSGQKNWIVYGGFFLSAFINDGG